MSASTYLPSKPRYEILDGLRGVAALIVVAFHLFETYSAGVTHQMLNHGYLAVDFFVLSGFVIGYAYDDRWGRMTTWQFFKRRLIRLHPMLVAGSHAPGLAHIHPRLRSCLHLCPRPLPGLRPAAPLRRARPRVAEAQTISFH